MRRGGEGIWEAKASRFRLSADRDYRSTLCTSLFSLAPECGGLRPFSSRWGVRYGTVTGWIVMPQVHPIY